MRPSRALLQAVLGGLSACSLLCASGAWAQADGALARALFHEARVLADAGDYARACPKLEESLRLDPGMGTRFNLAHCWEKLGRTASAWTLFLDVAAAARAQGMAEREAAARSRADELEPRLTRLRVEVPVHVRGMSIQLDGKELNEPAWGTPVPIDPGRHRLEARAPGRQAWSQELEIAATAEVHAASVPELAPLAAASPPVEAPAPPVRGAEPSDPSRADVGSSGFGTWSWVAIGVGAAAAATGVVFQLRVQSSISEADALCNGGPAGDACVRDQPSDPLIPWDGGEAEKSEWQALASDIERERALSYVSFGVAGAAFVGAFLLYWVADGDEQEGSGAVLGFAPRAGARGWDLMLQGRF